MTVMDSIDSQNQAVSAPPPPQEVKVRTMASDLASMAASGGGLPQFRNVKIAAKLPQKGSGGGDNNVIVIAIVIVAVLVLVAVGYFGYVALQKQNAALAPATGGQ